MRLLYLSYWRIDDALTHATVFPHLEVLAGSARIDRIVFVSVERGPAGTFPSDLAGYGIKHVPLHARASAPAVLARSIDFVRFPSALARLSREHGITSILARGANAGALAHLVQRHVAVPYAVESFEPHATYMLDSGVWGRADPRYLFQRRWERAQKREATALLPVTEAYRKQLVSEGISEDRVVTLPCTADTDRFRFDAEARARARAELRAPPDAVIGIYVGKFGGIYYDKEAFDVFARFASGLRDFRMVVLTPTDPEQVRMLARSAGFPVDHLAVASVAHREVPRFLCAADVAFATVRMAASRRALSLVKVGEYLASGLPIVITEGVGDDSDIIRDQDAGAVIDLSDETVRAAAERVLGILAEPHHRARIAALAIRFRSRDQIHAAYAKAGFF